MLQSIRDRASGWLAGLLVVLISIPFALWGINRYFSGGQEQIVAKVNGQEITASAFQREYEQRYTEIQQAYGSQFDPSMINQAKFKRQVLDAMVRNQLLEQHVHGAGFAISNQELADQVYSIPAFQKNGKFSEQLYRERLQQQGYVPSQFEHKLRNAIELDQLRNGVLGTALATRQDVDAYIRMRYQKRRVAYAQISAQHFLPAVKVSDAEVHDYYKQHASAFMTPDRVRLRYVELSPDTVAKTIKVNEAELRQYYQGHIQRYTTPERRHALHILIKPKNGNDAAALKKAQGIRKKALSGESFRKLAREYSDDAGSAKQGGDLGWIAPGEMAKPFDKALFQLQKGQVSPVVKTHYGYDLIKLVGIRPKQTKSFQQVRKQVMQSYRENKANNEMYDLGQKLANITFEHPDSLQPAAQQLGLKVQDSGWITHQGGKGIGKYDKVVKAAFKPQVLDQGMNSDPVQLKGGQVIVLRVAKHEKPQQEPLSQVRARIEKRLRQQKAAARARAEGVSILKQLRKSGAALSSIKGRAGLDYHPLASIQRDDQNLDPALTQAIFRMPRPGAHRRLLDGVALSNGDYALVALHGIEDGDPAKLSAKRRSQIGEELAARQGNAEFDAYVEALRQKGKVKEYPDRL